METTFKVPTPADFAPVIEAVLSWAQTQPTTAAVVIALQGDLGAGKTTFTQLLGATLGVTDVIVSPTFMIMRQYELEHERFSELIHIDAYRMINESELGPLKLRELLQQSDKLVCIEWPEQVPALIPTGALWVQIEIGEGETRKVVLKQ